MSILNSMIAGMILCAGIGYLLDRWIGTRFLAALGAVVGLGLSIYVVVVKYGMAEQAVPGRTSTTGLGDDDQVATGDPATGGHRKETE